MAGKNNKRLFLSLSEEDVAKLDILCQELGMNRSQYIRYLLSGQSKRLCPSIQYQKLVEHFSQIDLSLRTIALKEILGDADKLAIYCKLEELRKLLQTEGAFGQVGHKLSSEVTDGR